MVLQTPIQTRWNIVDTVFGHVPRIGRSEDRQDRAIVTGLQESCR